MANSRATSVASAPAGCNRLEPEPSDEFLVQAVLAGDDAQFERLVRRHQRQIVNFVYRLVGDFELAMDLSQDVFVRAYQALGRFDPTFRFTTWLYRIASNCAIDTLRRHRLPTVSLDASLSSGEQSRQRQIASDHPDPAQFLEARETMRKLQAAIRHLPPGYRRLIVLRHVNSLRYEQIASITGLPLGTVKNRIFRARALLRRELDRPEPARSSRSG